MKYVWSGVLLATLIEVQRRATTGDSPFGYVDPVSNAIIDYSMSAMVGALVGLCIWGVASWWARRKGISNR